LTQPASDLDAAGWAAINSGEPVCVITELTDGAVGATAVHTASTIDEAEARFGPGVRRLFHRGVDQTVVLERAVVTSLWPVPVLVVVGGGQIAAALVAAAGLLEWTARVVDTPADAIEAITGRTHADAVVVLSHDPETGGRALLTALAGGAGYVGGLGSNHTQVDRAAWLMAHGVAATDVERIHGPAGLDIGAFTAAEVATAITAEIIAVRSGAAGGSLRGRTGPVRSV
jgi:xanthine dehydrogenase accessory factor